MKISISQKRESFDRIFEDSVSKFLTEIYKVPVRVNWNTKKTALGLENQIWYCNPLINSIVVKNANKEVYRSFIDEYKTNPLTKWKSFMQRLYLLFASTPQLAHHFASNVIEINPGIESAKNKIFIGGNTKIRFIDLDKQSVYAILKRGYDSSYIKNDIAIRKKYPHLPAPKIFSVSDEHDWYSEEYIWGVSPDRMSNTVGDAYITDAISGLHQLYDETIHSTPSDIYISSLMDSIKIHLNNCQNLTDDVVNRVKDTVVQLTKRLLKSPSQPIVLCQNHGDLQLGNIICNEKEDKFWVIDWEFTRMRQYGYDYFVMVLLARSKGLMSRLATYYDNSISAIFPKYTSSWQKLDLDNIKYLLLLYLLEELDFRVEEQVNISTHENTGIVSFLKVIDHFTNSSDS